VPLDIISRAEVLRGTPWSKFFVTSLASNFFLAFKRYHASGVKSVHLMFVRECRTRYFKNKELQRQVTKVEVDLICIP
jgi:hypothetical protein